MFRLASLVASNSDILAALGVSEWVVAVDQHSDAPGLERARRVGLDLEINLPALIETRPDLVLASLSVPGMERVVQQVQEAGLNTLVLDPLSWRETLDSITQVGERLGLAQQAKRVVEQLDRELDSLRTSFHHPPRVVVEWWPRPVIVATQQSWITDLLERLGAVNAFAERPGRSAPLHWTEVVAAQPDLIICSWCGAKKLRPELIEARGLGVPVVPVLESGLGRPGPRLLEGAQQISAALRVWEAAFKPRAKGAVS